MEETIAEHTISELPYSGHIHLTFIRITPTIKMIHKLIPLQYLSRAYKQVHEDLNNAGVSLKIIPSNVCLSDYYKFVCKLFPEFEVQDRQTDKVGKPDFFLINKQTEFYLEVKNGNDGIRHSQMSWVSNNPDKEIWFLFIGNISIEEDNKTRFYYESN